MASEAGAVVGGGTPPRSDPMYRVGGGAIERFEPSQAAPSLYFLPAGSVSSSKRYFLPEQALARSFPTITRAGRYAFDVQRVRQDFPLLQRKVNGLPLVWLDNAATSQKPYPVIEALRRFYSDDNSNIHRGPIRWLIKPLPPTRPHAKKCAAS
jgi:cysteine desulfurase/selenocysteine lyase